MYVYWRQVKNRHYAYLGETIYDKEKKGPKSRMVYLGGTVAEAERKLREHLTSGKVAIPGLEQRKLIQQLIETAPDKAKKPKRDIPLESTIKLLTRQRDKYQNRPDIAKPLQAALEALQAAKSTKQV